MPHRCCLSNASETKKKARLENETLVKNSNKSNTFVNEFVFWKHEDEKRSPVKDNKKLRWTENCCSMLWRMANWMVERKWWRWADAQISESMISAIQATKLSIAQRDSLAIWSMGAVVVVVVFFFTSNSKQSAYLTEEKNQINEKLIDMLCCCIRLRHRHKS